MTWEQWLSVQIVGFAELEHEESTNHDREHLHLCLAYIVIELDTTSLPLAQFDGESASYVVSIIRVCAVRTSGPVSSKKQSNSTTREGRERGRERKMRPRAGQAIARK